jgi:hypothetical protein
MTEEEKNKEINKLSVKNGLLIGGIYVVLSAIFHIIDPLMAFTNIWVQFLTFVIIIAIVVILAVDVRKKVGGFWNFGQAYRGLIIGTLFITLFSIGYGFVLFKFIDPSLPGKVKDVTVEKLQERLTKAGMDQDKIDKVSEPLTNGDFEARLQPTFKNELTNFGVGLLIYAIIDLIIAASIKKEPPLFDVIDPEPTV